VQRLALARLVSVTGTVSADVALAAVLYAKTGSAALLISFATPAVLAPLAGAIADRFDRRRILIASDLLGACCFVAMAFASMPALLLALAFPAAVCASPFLPASGGLVPWLAPPERLAWANSRLAVARTTAQVVGPLVGGGVVALASGRAAFALNAASFVLSAALIATLRGRFRATAAPAPAAAPASEPTATTPQPSRISEGIRLIVREPILRALTLGFVLVDFGNGVVLPAEVALAHHFGAGAAGYGAIVALWGVGGVAGAHVAGRLIERHGEPPVIVATAACLALSFALTALSPWFALALGALSLGGGSMSVAGVGEDVLLQRRVEDSLRGRVYGAHIAAVQLSLAVPLLFAGFLVGSLGPQAVYALAAALCCLGVLALLRLLRAGGATAGPRAPRARA
jgi:MFS family permease